MDNLTHSLAGALLGQAGLKRLSGRAMPTLIIAANIPDIDAFATLLGTESLAIRRGITHGPLAMLLLPLALTGVMLAFNRWRPASQPIRPGALLLLAYIGTLSHPALDFLNSYGIRLLEPFSSRWVYGDTLFIIDVWMWAALILGFGISRRLEKRGGEWRPPAWISLGAIGAYILANGLITVRAETLARTELGSKRLDATMAVASPQPLTFWTRRMLWRNHEVHGQGAFHLLDGLHLDGSVSRNNLDHPALIASRHRDDVRAYLFWSRMPFVFEQDGRAFLADQRFSSSLTRRNFVVPLDSAPGAP